MASSDEQTAKALEEAVLKAQEAVARQGDIVRGLKAEMKDGRVVRVCLDIKNVFFMTYCVGSRTLRNIFWE